MATGLVLISFTVRGDQEDAARKKATKNVATWFDLSNFADLDAIQDKHDEMAEVIDNITGAVIEASSCQVLFDLPAGLKGAALADHLVQKGALVNFDLSGSQYSESIWFPAIRETLVLGDNVGVDIANAAFTALAAAVSNGIAAIPAVNKFNIAFGDIQSGVVAFRK